MTCTNCYYVQEKKGVGIFQTTSFVLWNEFVTHDSRGLTWSLVSHSCTCENTLQDFEVL